MEENKQHFQCIMLYCFKKGKNGTSAQDGVVGKCNSPPCTTTAKLQLKYRRTITWNHQKIELYGSPTTKELKKPHLALAGVAQWIECQSVNHRLY